MTRGLALDLGRRALGDLLAVVEHRDPVGDAHDDLHVVLDQQDRQAELVAQLPDEARQLRASPAGSCRRSARRAAAARLGRQRAGDLQAALVAVGQVPGESSRAALEPDEVEQLARARSCACSSSRTTPGGRRIARPAGRLEPRVHARPARSPARSCCRTGGCSGRCGRCRARDHLVRLRAGDVAAVEDDLARGRARRGR